ncbi:hypothetical protein [Nocardiopsis dassonvillei]|uniref:hypothetical protein n=1 Tax=Nocardiopsis dassonvillei TaxID=2014 RepID=UPI00362EAD2A
MTEAPGQAEEIARSTMPGGSGPGTHMRMRSPYTLMEYSHTRCGCPNSRRFQSGRSVPSI